MFNYFSDNYNSSSENISVDVWNGIVALYNEMVSNNNFAKFYPLDCSDGGGIYGTNDKLLERAIKSEIPDISIPIRIEVEQSPSPFEDTEEGLMLFPVLDFIEFQYRHLCKSIQVGKYHDFFNHFHLSFDNDIKDVQNYFRAKINTIFYRNKMPYSLDEKGKIIRLVSETTADLIKKEIFNTPDAKLNQLLNTAFLRFKSPRSEDRREALDILWDAYEQLKTHYGANGGTTASINAIIDSVSYDCEVLREHIASDAKELYSIGNKTDIRHKNTDVAEIKDDSHVDYLFFRMSNLIHLLLKHFEIEYKKEN